MLRKFWLLFAQACTICVGALFVVTTLRPDLLPRLAGKGNVVLLQETATPTAGSRIASYADAARKAMPSVVNIYSSKAVKSRNSLLDDSLLQHYFPGFADRIPQHRATSLGSGVIVAAEGYVLTNHHVVDGADDIEIVLPDGRQVPARIRGTDPESDLAVLKVDVDQLPAVTFGNMDSLQVGDVVLAIGNPFGFGSTVTLGIVSALGRNHLGINQFEDFIQTDAAINPGNSGGPLLDMAGEVIGINTAIYTQSGTYAGVGFAMPSNTVISVYNQLISPAHKVVRGSIGITFQGNLPSAVSRVYGFKSGVLISSVQPGFAADKAGLKPGDIITTVDGRPIKDGDDLVSDISARKPGSTAKVGYIRNGQSLEATVTIGDRAKMIAAAGSAQDQEESTSPESPDASQSKLGLSVSDLPQNAPAGLHGVVVQSVKPGSFADEINLSSAQGMVIVSVNRHLVHNVAEFRSIVAGLKTGDDVVFELVDPQRPRGGSSYVGGTLR